MVTIMIQTKDCVRRKYNNNNERKHGNTIVRKSDQILVEQKTSQN